MSIDITIGRRTISDEDGRPCAIWHGNPTGDDGTDKEYTIFPGQPRRSIGYQDDIGPVMDAFNAQANDMKAYAPIDHTMLVLIGLMPQITPLERDRASWFTYWAQRAVAEFGPEACIEVYW